MSDGIAIRFPGGHDRRSSSRGDYTGPEKRRGQRREEDKGLASRGASQAAAPVQANHRDAAARTAAKREQAKWMRRIGTGSLVLAAAGSIDKILSGEGPKHAAATPDAYVSTNTGLMQPLRPPRSLGDRVTVPAGLTEGGDASEKETQAAAQTLGIVIDVDAETLSRYALSLDDGALKATPITTAKGSKWIYYSSNLIDPLVARQRIVDRPSLPVYLDELREQVREQDRLLPERSNSHAANLPIWRGADHTKAFTLADLPDGVPVSLRLKLDTTTLDWIERGKGSLNTIIQEATRAIGHRTVGHGDYASFLEEMLVDPQTQKPDWEAFRTLNNLFGLTREDRQIFADAVKHGDITKARGIVLQRSSAQPFQEDLYAALTRFITVAKERGTEPSVICNALQKAQIHENYVFLPKSLQSMRDSFASHGKEVPAEWENAYALMPLLHETLSSAEYSRMISLGPMPLKFLSEHIAFRDAPSTYQEFLDDYNKAIRSSENQEAKHFLSLLSPRVMAIVKRNLSALVGTETSEGWLDFTDEKLNMQSLMTMVMQRQILASSRTQVNIPSLSHDAGGTHLTVDLRKLDNREIGWLSEMIYHAQADHPFLGSTHDPEFNDTLENRLAMLMTPQLDHSADGSDSSLILLSPTYLARYLQNFSPPQAIEPLLATAPDSGIEVKQTEPIPGITVTTYEKPPGKYASAVEATSREPTQAVR